MLTNHTLNYFYRQDALPDIIIDGQTIDLSKFITTTSGNVPGGYVKLNSNGEIPGYLLPDELKIDTEQFVQQSAANTIDGWVKLDSLKKVPKEFLYPVDIPLDAFSNVIQKSNLSEMTSVTDMSESDICVVEIPYEIDPTSGEYLDKTGSVVEPAVLASISPKSYAYSNITNGWVQIGDMSGDSLRLKVLDIENQLLDYVKLDQMNMSDGGWVALDANGLIPKEFITPISVDDLPTNVPEGLALLDENAQLFEAQLPSSVPLLDTDGKLLVSNLPNGLYPELFNADNLDSLDDIVTMKLNDQAEVNQPARDNGDGTYTTEDDSIITQDEYDALDKAYYIFNSVEWLPLESSGVTITNVGDETDISGKIDTVLGADGQLPILLPNGNLAGSGETLTSLMSDILKKSSANAPDEAVVLDEFGKIDPALYDVHEYRLFEVANLNDRDLIDVNDIPIMLEMVKVTLPLYYNSPTNTYTEESGNIIPNDLASNYSFGVYIRSGGGTWVRIDSSGDLAGKINIVPGFDGFIPVFNASGNLVASEKSLENLYNDFISKDELGVPGGIAPLDANGLIPNSALPNLNTEVFEVEHWTERDLLDPKPGDVAKVKLPFFLVSVMIDTSGDGILDTLVDQYQDELGNVIPIEVVNTAIPISYIRKDDGSWIRIVDDSGVTRVNGMIGDVETIDYEKKVGLLKGTISYLGANSGLPNYVIDELSSITLSDVTPTLGLVYRLYQGQYVEGSDYVFVDIDPSKLALELNPDYSNSSVTFEYSTDSGDTWSTYSPDSELGYQEVSSVSKIRFRAMNNSVEYKDIYGFLLCYE